MRLIQLPLVLLLSSFVSAAAIPSSPHSVVTPEWSSPETASSPSLDDANSGHLAKRRPYYFPETVPDEEEIAARLSALREAGYLPDTQTLQGHDQKSIGTPDAAIDMDPSSARPSPTQEPPSALSERDTPRFSWADTIPGLFPAAWFFVFASVVAVTPKTRPRPPTASLVPTRRIIQERKKKKTPTADQATNHRQRQSRSAGESFVPHRLCHCAARLELGGWAKAAGSLGSRTRTREGSYASSLGNLHIYAKLRVWNENTVAT
ncbi:unnamed protein product [Penicillium manginii]